MRILKVLLLTILTLLFTSACSSNGVNSLHSKQKVTVESIPSGSDVYMDGDLIGTTPMVLSLRSDISHEIHFKKEGFKSSIEYLDPIFKDDKTPYLQFGLAKDLGYYYQLSSDHIITQLHWEHLPNTTGILPFEAMSELVAKADDAKLSGNLSSDEHKIIVRQIIEMFHAK